ncbi:FkbM family methyltransferase [Prosthecobacter fluviatilis]|uniref:FkbM family methyltransferase n=1 Tax=Prosthecobacter fluviatilis TaxID=445931 RepID=A0ABW0KSR1_9BACT
MRRLLHSLLSRHASLYLYMLRLLKRGTIEKKIFLALIRPGDVVFDVGANEGYFTLLASDLVGSGGKVHAFEPVPPTFRKAEANLLQMQVYNNYCLNLFACSDEAGDVMLHVPEKDFGQASMRVQDAGSWKDVQNIETYCSRAIRLDDYINEHQISRVDFMKIDVEGAELHALRGSQKMIGRFRPMLFLEVCESWMRNFQCAPPDLAAFLLDHGYTDFFIAGNKVERTSDIKRALAELPVTASVNVLCVTAAHAERIERMSLI